MGQVLLQGDAQSQSLGRAPPSPIPGTRECADDFFRVAHALNPAVSLLQRAVPDAKKGIDARFSAYPADDVRRRSVVLKAFESLSEVLAPLRSRWISEIPANSPAAGIDFPLIHFIAAHFSYEDAEFATDLSHGMPVAGFPPAMGTLTPRYRPAVTTLESRRADFPARNRLVPGRVKATPGKPVTEECWNATLAQVGKGWAAWPVPVTDDMMNSVALTPRYAIGKANACVVYSHKYPILWGGRARNLRAVDDSRASGINDTMTLADASVPEHLGSSLALPTYRKQVDPECAAHAFALDFPHAYKHVPILSSRREFAAIAPMAPCGTPRAACLRSQPLGPRSAPPDWAFETRFPKWMSAEFSDIAIHVYAGDIYCAEPRRTCEPSFLAAKAVCRLLGLVFEYQERTTANARPVAVTCPVGHFGCVMRGSLPGPKRLGLIYDLKQILKVGRLTPAQAAKMRGRIGFRQSLLYGRVGRSLLSPFSDRQYSTATGTQRPLSGELRDATRRWINELGRTMPRCVAFNPLSLSWCTRTLQGPAMSAPRPSVKVSSSAPTRISRPGARPRKSSSASTRWRVEFPECALLPKSSRGDPYSFDVTTKVLMGRLSDGIARRDEGAPSHVCFGT